MVPSSESLEGRPGVSGAAGGARRARVLVVDDEEFNREVLLGALEEEFDVAMANDGPGALQAFARTPPDLVLLDIMMPGMNGFDVCRRLKASATEGFLPILLVTALGEQEHRNTGLEAGADDFLTKPVDRRELLLRVRSFLRIREQDTLLRAQLEENRSLHALKDDLFSLIVHDLRNPLAGVSGFLQIADMALGDAPANAGVRGDVRRALEGTRRIEETLRDLLEIRLIEEGELTAKREPLEPGALVREAVATVEGAARAQRVALEVDVAGDAPQSLPLDRKLVRRAIENLLSNAIKYSRSGSAVTASVRAAPGGAAIEVADRGPGIPAELKTAMFQKFGSIEVKRGEERRGFGLGLHLVKLVATAHGGEASVRDREGGGSVFRLSFPAQGAPPRPA